MAFQIYYDTTQVPLVGPDNDIINHYLPHEMQSIILRVSCVAGREDESAAETGGCATRKSLADAHAHKADKGLPRTHNQKDVICRGALRQAGGEL